MCLARPRWLVLSAPIWASSDRHLQTAQQSKMMAAFRDAMAKMAVLGQDRSQLVDCSEVIPDPQPVKNRPHYPAGFDINDIEQAVRIFYSSSYCPVAPLLIYAHAIVRCPTLPDAHHGPWPQNRGVSCVSCLPFICQRMLLNCPQHCSPPS